jgi:hypothetical protein
MPESKTSAIERVLSEIPDKSHAHQYLRYARYKTKAHEKVELGSGAIVALVTALASFFLAGAGWGAIPLAVVGFAATVALIFFWHWIHAASAFHEHWEAKARELPLPSDSANRRKQAIADRIRDLLREAAEVDFGEVELGSGSHGPVIRAMNHRERVKNFLEAHFDSATAERYKEDGNRILEELLVDALRDEKRIDTRKK